MSRLIATANSNDLSTLATPHEIGAGDLPSAILQGGPGEDILVLLDGGTFDLTLPAIFAGFETIRGSEQHDAIVLNAARFDGVAAFDGGPASATHWDKILLQGAAFDVRAKVFTGIDELSLATDGAELIVDDLATALIAGGIASQHDRLIATTLTFTAPERMRLHRQGIDTILDAGGEHVNAPPVTAGLQGDRIEAAPGQRYFLDVGRDAAISDDDGTFSLLTVAAPQQRGPPGRLGIDLAGMVALSAGYAPGSTVTVGGADVGMLWDASDIGLSIAFNADATLARVEEIVRAITFTTATIPPDHTTHHEVSVTLADEGGRRSSSIVTIVQSVEIEPPPLVLSHASVAELAPDGALVGFLTARIPGVGDAFAYALLDNAENRFSLDGDRLLVLNGIKLDYEQHRSHTITVRATGPGNVIVDQVFTIVVEDVLDETIIGVGNGAGGDDAGGGTSNGSRGANTLVGGRGKDKLKGGEGRDILYGKGGNDVLTGGEDADIFVFDTKPHTIKNLDRIADFNPKYDDIQLDDKVFRKLREKGSPENPAPLSKAAFWKGAAAHDKNDRVIYDPRTGALFYDPDGTGSAASSKFAVTKPKLALSHKDIFVI